MTTKDTVGVALDSNQKVEKDAAADASSRERGSPKKRMCGGIAQCALAPTTRRQKLLCTAFWLLVVGLVLIILLWLVPKVVTDGILPLSKKMDKALTTVEVGLVLAACVMITPLVFVPFYPFVWLCAPLLHMWTCFAIVEVASTAGMLLSYYLGKTVMRNKAQHWADSNDTLRALFTALDRVGPFKTILLLRITPVPYAIINYCSAVPPNLSVYTYIVASFIGLFPRHLLWVYFGRNLKGIVAFLQGKPMPTAQLVYNVVALVVAFVVVVGGIITASMSLRKVHREQAEAAAAADEEAQASASDTDSSAIPSGVAAASSGSSSDVRDVAAPLAAAAAARSAAV